MRVRPPRGVQTEPLVHRAANPHRCNQGGRCTVVAHGLIEKLVVPATFGVRCWGWPTMVVWSEHVTTPRGQHERRPPPALREHTTAKSTPGPIKAAPAGEKILQGLALRGLKGEGARPEPHSRFAQRLATVRDLPSDGKRTHLGPGSDGRDKVHSRTPTNTKSAKPAHADAQARQGRTFALVHITSVSAFSRNWVGSIPKSA